MVAILRIESGQDSTTCRRYSRNLISDSGKAMLGGMDLLPDLLAFDTASVAGFAAAGPSTPLECL